MAANPNVFKKVTVGQLLVPGLWHGMSKTNYGRFLQHLVSNRATKVPVIPGSAAGGHDLLGPGWYFTPVLKEAFKYMNLGVAPSEQNQGKMLLCILSTKKVPEFNMALTENLIKQKHENEKAHALRTELISGSFLIKRDDETEEAHALRTKLMLEKNQTPDILLYHRYNADDSAKLKMSNHVDRKYMIVLVFNCTDIKDGVDLALDVKETMRLMPDGWEALFDPSLGATLRDSRLPISSIGVRTDRIITYNLCFGCMSGVDGVARTDKTGGEFAVACAKDENVFDLNGTRVSECVRHAASNLNELGAKDALFIALQELSSKDTVEHIVALSPGLADFQVFVHDSPLQTGTLTHICSLVAKDVEVLERSGGSVEPGRGWLMLFCRGRGTHFLLVNLHNKHGDPTLATLRQELSDNFDNMQECHKHLLSGSPLDVYVAGDLNTKQPHDRNVTLRPFADWASRKLARSDNNDNETEVFRKQADVTLTSSGTTNTCCVSRLQNGNTDVRVERDRNHSHIADHVLCASNRTAVVTRGGRFEASDHLPVCVDVECVASNSVPGAAITLAFDAPSHVSVTGTNTLRPDTAGLGTTGLGSTMS